ncbi:hypothetical protein GCM10009638_06310 [Luteococcus sanguinis]
MGEIRREWGTFRKLSSGKYQASYLGPDGKRHRGRTTFDDKDAARIWLRREKRLIDDGEWISPADQQAKKVQAPSIIFGDYSSEWLDRRRTRKGPLEPIYAAVFIDAIVIKVRDGQVRNQPYYANESVLTSTATRTFWGSGPATASRRSSGSPASQNSRTGV